MSKQLVIVNQDTGYLFVDVANAALEEYDEVTLLAGSVVELGTKLNSAITVRKIPRYRRTSIRSRLLSWIIGFTVIFFLIYFRHRKSDLLLSSNPPLNLLLPLLMPRRRFFFYALDLYPEALHKTGIVSPNNIIVKAWGRLNAKAYKNCSHIWALTPSMQALITDTYDVPASHASAWSCSLSTEADFSILLDHGLVDSWIVLYSGNLGKEHELNILLDSAAELLSLQGLTFVIAGEGWQKQSLLKRVSADGLSNVQLLPKLCANKYMGLLKSAKLAVVSQSLRTSDICIPSKTFNILAAGVPVLGIGAPSSDFGKMINDLQSGHVFSPKDKKEMISFLLNCFHDDKLIQRLRKNAERAGKDYDKDNARKLLRAMMETQSNGE